MINRNIRMISSFAVLALVIASFIYFLCKPSNSTGATFKGGENLPVGDVTNPPTATRQPNAAENLSGIDKKNIESVIQLARQTGGFTRAEEIDGSTLYHCLDYYFNTGIDVNGQRGAVSFDEGYVGMNSVGLSMYTQKGLRTVLGMFFGKNIDFDECVEYAKNFKDPDIKLLEGGNICIIPHDGDGGDLGAPFDQEHLAKITNLGDEKYAVSTDVHEINYNYGEGTTDVIVGHSSYSVARDPSSIFGFIVLSANPAG